MLLNADTDCDPDCDPDIEGFFALDREVPHHPQLP
jgi:hypothetical protein